MSNATESPPARPYLTPPEIAEMLGIAAEKVCRWIARGELRATNTATTVGGRPRWRVHRIDLDTFLAARANTTPVERSPRRKQPSGFTEFIPID